MAFVWFVTLVQAIPFAMSQDYFLRSWQSLTVLFPQLAFYPLFLQRKTPIIWQNFD
jgi:hypothetical protein